MASLHSKANGENWAASIFNYGVTHNGIEEESPKADQRDKMA